MANWEEIGQRIRRERKRLNMTAQGLGDLIGVSTSTILAYEQGKPKATVFENVQRIADGLGLPITTLLPLGPEQEGSECLARIAPFLSGLDSEDCDILVDMARRLSEEKKQ